MQRRHFLAGLGSSALLPTAFGLNEDGPPSPTIQLALKAGMAKFGTNLEEKFTILKGLGYDGIELDSPGGQNKKEALSASGSTGLPIHGVVDSIHWKIRLSDPSAEIRAKALEGLRTAITECAQVGGSSVLLVPGVVDKHTTHEEAWTRSIESIRAALPLAASKSIHILIENVGNRMFYDEKGGNRQAAESLAKYLDEINSPWVGSYFDIGNHQRFGKPADWIRLLGRRIVKLDVKDWGTQAGFCKIGDGDVDWPEVRKALEEIGFTGWATAEVKGGDADRCAEILSNMRQHLLGA